MKMQDASFNAEVADPGFSAVLATLGFPLLRAPRQTVKADLNSGHAPGDGCSVAWRFGAASVTEPGLTFDEVARLWGLPHGPQDPMEPPHVVRLMKGALHNYRVLLTQVHHNGGLWCGPYGLGCRLSSWSSAGYTEVPEVQTWEVPLGAEGSTNTAEVAVAVTLGIPLESRVRVGREVRWHFGLPVVHCPYTAAQVHAVLHDVEYIRGNKDPLATLLALFHNRKTLREQVAAAEGKTLVLCKRGRYAVLSSAAERGTQEAALRHLNV